MALTDNILYYHKFDSDLYDSVTGTNLWGGNATLAAGKINNGAVFNGTNSYVQLVSTTWGISNAFTFSAWIKTSTTGVTQQIINKDNSSGDRNFQFRVETGGNIGFVKFNTSNGVDTYATTASSIADGSWHHVVATFSTSGASPGLKIYVDGTNAGGGASTAVIQDTSMPAFFGRFSGSPVDFFNGMIDEIGIWTRQLSASEITQLYNSGAGLQYPFGGGATVNSGFFNLM